MKSPRKQRWQQLQSVFEPGFKQMLLVSILIHLLVPALYYSPLFPAKEIKKPPVYRVNLINKIVKNPQAGRPEATAVKKKPKVKPKPKPIRKPKIKPKPKPIKPKLVKPKSKSKPVPAKPKSKSKPKPVVSKAKDDALQLAIKRMQAKRDSIAASQAQKEKIATLKAAILAESQIDSPVVDAPVGVLGGKGDGEGLGAKEKVGATIAEQWRLSKYQVPTLDLKAIVIVTYNKAGKRIAFDFEDMSGNTIFDRTILDTMAKTSDLGFPLLKTETFTIEFNLKDLKGL